jgi:hypothetical protein
MRLLNFLLLLFLTLQSCDIQLGPSFNPKEDKLPKPVRNQDMGFKELKKNLLYIDLKKNIYIKFGEEIVLENENRKVTDYRYFNLIKYQDTVLPLQKIVDVKSFGQINRLKFEDKNHYYIYNQNAKRPPLFTCFEKKIDL